MALTVVDFMNQIGTVQILLWLLTFAVLYGVLSQINVPKSREAQAIIAIVVGFMVILSPASGALAMFMAKMSSGLVLVGVGLLLVFIFFEIGRLNDEVKVGTDSKTGRPIMKKVSMLSDHPYITSIALLIIVGLIFVSAGGLQLLGIQNMNFNFNMSGVIVLIAMILAIVWMTKGEK